MYYFMSCFDFLMLDGSVKQAETRQSEEEEKMGTEQNSIMIQIQIAYTILFLWLALGNQDLQAGYD